MTLTTNMTAAEDALLTLLQSAAGLSDVDVRLGDPGPEAAAEVVWIAEDAEAERVPDVTMSASSESFEESYDLEVRILVFQRGDDYKALRDRAYALTNAVEITVQDNRRLGTAVFDAYIQKVVRNTGATNEGRGIEMRVTVHIDSYLAV